jgi:DDE superfamily endonuclease
LNNDKLLEQQIGLNRDELYFVWSSVKQDLVTHYEAKHWKREPTLLPFASLLVTLHWFRHYPTTELLTAMTDAVPSVIHEHLQHTTHSLHLTIVPQCFTDYPIPHRGFKEGCLANVRLVVDSTWITLPQHTEPSDRHDAFHPKAPGHQGLKYQLCTTTDGVPWHISDVVIGSVSDATLIRESGLLDLLGEQTLIVGDKGYQGVEKLVTPTKKPRGGELAEEDAAKNNIIYSKRVVVENTFHQLKQWAVLGSVYRGEWRTRKDYQRVTEIVHVICAFVKIRLEKHPLRAHPKATP